MSVIGSNVLAGASGGAGAGYAIERSLRFNSGDSAYLNRTPSAAGNRKTWTWSGWVKRSKLGSDQTLFSADHGSGNWFVIQLNASDQLQVNWTTGTGGAYLLTTQVFRDPASFSHLVVSFDTTQSTAANRVKVYFNGSQITNFSNEQYPNQDTDYQVNNTVLHKIGHGAAYIDLYLADVHFIDGQVLAATDFGETDGSGVWQPKEYAGGFDDWFDNSRTWSGDVTGSAYSAAYAATNGFDNSLSTRAGGSFTFTPPSPIACTKVKIYMVTYANDGSGNTPTGKVFLNGVDIASQIPVTSAYAVPLEFTPSNNQFVSYQCTGDGNEPGWFSKIELLIDGVWVALVDSTVSLSNNGFHLDFADNSSNAALGTDTSGVSPANTWTVNNLSVAAGAGNDSLVDTPTNGTQTDSGAGGEITGCYCTLNPLKNQSQTLSNGNLVSNGNSGRSTGTIYASSGKVYWEFTAGTSYTMAGIESSTSPQAASYSGENDQQYALYGNAGSGQLYHNGGVTSVDGFVSGDVIGVALDMDGGNLYFYKNGVAMNSGTAVATGLTGAWTANCRSGSGGYNGDTIFNFGQRAFAYAAPSGYKSLNTANLPTPTIADGSKYFDTKLWTGNGGTQSVSNLGFSPDFAWIKGRSFSGDHALFDTVRGATKRLRSNQTNAENTDTNTLSAFTSDGFTLGSSSAVNLNNGTFSGWAWDAGANSDRTYTVTVSGGNFYIDGAQQPTLTLAEGSTYKFDQADSTNATHPLRFSTTSDGTHGGGTEYTTGVTTAGTPGSAGAYTQIVIAASAPTLYAYCTNHSGMGFQVNTSDKGGYTIPAGGLTSSVYNQSQTWSSGKDGDRSDYPVTNVFDASLTTLGYGSANQTITVTLPGGSIALTSLRVRADRAGTATGKFYVNGNDYTSQIASGTNWNTITGETSITSIAYASDSGSNFVGLYAVEVNGKQLVDSGVSVTNVPSIASQVMANPSAGFSIVSFTGTGSSGSIGHGLNVTPDLYILKDRDNSTDWLVYTTKIDGSLDYLNLNNTNAKANSSFTAPTSAVFTYSTDAADYIAYCFAPVEGYSAMGSYTGNGSSSDGPFVYTGFKIAWLMVKNTTTSGETWTIYDAARDPHNLATNRLQPNSSDAETSGTAARDKDFLSNGFKVRGGSGEQNTSGDNYVYLAFASNPFASNGGLAR